MKHFLFVAIAVMMLTSCSNEKENPTQPISTEKSQFEEIKKRTVTHPKDAEAWQQLAELYERAEMYREEVAALNTVIALAPNNRAVYPKLASAYSRLGQHPEAIKSYIIAIKHTPENPVLYNNIAVSYGKVGKIPEETAALEKAISLRPRYATARYNLGIIRLRQGDRVRALEQYREINTFDAGIAAALKKEIDAKGGLKK